MSEEKRKYQRKPKMVEKVIEKIVEVPVERDYTFNEAIDLAISKNPYVGFKAKIISKKLSNIKL